MSTLPANDTTPATLTIGATHNVGAWRVQRWTGRIEAIALENAGRRGKTCLVLSLSTPFTDETALDAAAPVILAAVMDGVHVETMRAIIMSEGVAGLTFRASELRGVDVPRYPAIKVVEPLVRGTFTEVEALCSFSFWLGKPGGLKHDEIVAAVARADAAKAYAWVKEHRGELAEMSVSGFRAEMSRIGARFR